MLVIDIEFAWPHFTTELICALVVKAVWRACQARLVQRQRMGKLRAMAIAGMGGAVGYAVESVEVGLVLVLVLLLPLVLVLILVLVLVLSLVLELALV